MSFPCPTCDKPTQADCCPHGSGFCEDHLHHCPQCRAALRGDWLGDWNEDHR